MHRRLGSLLVLGAAAALLSLGPASAGSPGRWTRVTATNIVNFEQPGLARTSDGVLHVVWQHPTGPLSEELIHTAVSPAGTTVGSDVKIVTGWRSVNQRPSLVRAPDGSLRVFFAGLHSDDSSDPLNGPLMTMTAPADGRTWTGPQRVTTVNGLAYGGAGIAAAVAGGSFVTAQGDPSNVFRFGIGVGPEFPYETRGCCVYQPGIGVDSVSGAVVLGWFSNLADSEGLYTQTISTAGLAGARSYAPGSATADRKSALQPSGSIPLTGRLGAAGVYLAYGAGYPSFKTVNLLQIGGSPRVVARGDVRNVGIAAAPEGRLWVLWELSNTAYFATRSNRAATRFEPATRIKRPAGTVSTFGLFAEGSLGQLDLLANIGKASNEVALYHTQVRPRLSAAASSTTLRSRLRRITFTVADAGDPLAGAKIKFAGKTLTTNASGKAVVVVRSGGKATVAKAGYTGAVVRA